jgi:hypothetical protein
MPDSSAVAAVLDPTVRRTHRPPVVTGDGQRPSDRVQQVRKGIGVELTEGGQSHLAVGAQRNESLACLFALGSCSGRTFLAKVLDIAAPPRLGVDDGAPGLSQQLRDWDRIGRCPRGTCRDGVWVGEDEVGVPSRVQSEGHTQEPVQVGVRRNDREPLREQAEVTHECL